MGVCGVTRAGTRPEPVQNVRAPKDSLLPAAGISSASICHSAQSNGWLLQGSDFETRTRSVPDLERDRQPTGAREPGGRS